MRRPLNRKRDDAGATLIEFAIVLPLLVMLLFGIIEFGWVFAQNLDVRHGAREGARLAAVDELTSAADVCSRMDTAAHPSETLITVARTGDDIGDDISVTVDAPAKTLTGFFDWALPSTLRLQSTVTIRAEQNSNFTLPATGCP